MSDNGANSGAVRPNGSFTRADTDASKGIAIWMLLFFHLFYKHPEFGPKLFGVPVVQWTSQIGVVCVAMFVLLSGYGLTESSRQKPLGLLGFYWRRFSRILVDYWFVWIVFVPPGVVFFGRSLGKVYGENIIGKLILNVSGLYSFLHLPSYNVTWWFVGLILFLYTVFPLLKWLSDRSPLGCLFLCTICWYLQFVRFNFIWLLPFGLGIYLSQVNGLVKLRRLLDRPSLTKALVYLVLLVVAVAQRQFGYVMRGSSTDWLLGLLVIMIGFEYLPRLPWLRQLLISFGHHSYNIFLFHTFIYYYYFPELTYGFRYPVLIWLFLAFVCLAISAALERLKDLLGVSALQAWIMSAPFAWRRGRAAT